MKKLAVALGVVFFATSLFAVHLWRELRAQHEQNGQLVTRVGALETAQLAQISAPVSREPVAQPPIVAGGQPVVALPAAAAPPAAREQSARGQPGSLLGEVQQTLNTPEGREFMRTIMRMNLDNEFPDLARELGLTADEAEKLLDLIARQRVDLGVQGASMLGGRDPAAREQAARARAEKEQANEAELAAMLGGKYQALKDYQRTAAERQRENAARQRADQLRNAVSVGSTPLSDAQFQALNTALAAEQRRIDRESGGLSMQQQVQRLPEANRRLAEVAAGHLTPEQLAGYRRYQEQQTGMASMVISAMGAMEVDDNAQGRPRNAANQSAD